MAMMDFTNLLEPQKNHGIKLLDSLYLNGCAADLSETGCGKSYVSAWVAKNLRVKPFVICPKNMRKTWNKVLSTFGVSAAEIINYEKIFRGNTSYFTYDKSFTKERNWSSEGINISFPKDSLVIVDEFHKCKGTDSLNGNGLLAIKNARFKTLMLSATAATNPVEMRAIGYALNLHQGDDFRHFCKESGAYYREGGMGTMDFDGDTKEGKEGMARVHDILFHDKKIASRMRRKDFGKIFPDNRIMVQGIDMGSNTGKIQDAYRLMEFEIGLLDERAANYSAHVFAIMMEARRRTELLKVPKIADMMIEMRKEGISPVVFLNFKDSIAGVSRILEDNKLFKGKLSYIHGDIKGDARDWHLEQFQSNKHVGMISQIDSGGVGLSMHDLHGDFPRHSIINPGFKAINFAQAFGRIHRAEGKSPCIQHVLIAGDTIEEERIAPRIQMRLDNLDLLNDGDLSGLMNLNSPFI